MTGPLALVVVLVVAILAPCLYFVYGARLDDIDTPAPLEEDS